ncbi:TnsA-like heteromeric transposase endonuclease subunit [Nocardia fluminea]|uniref:TnsA-like heteromeric transposase endonuclease subunit n=1 Tax=Nocardia fluminea TaxID=134984 RepID=UPI00366FC993
MNSGRDLTVVNGSAAAFDERFVVGFIDADRSEARLPLTVAVDVAFERVPPARSIPSYKGQRNNPGWYYSCTVGAHVEYESWLERDEAVALDFDAQVIGYAAQPFWLFWSEGLRPRSHAPDFFARLDNGDGVVIDCRPAHRIMPRDRAAFDATERACAEVGWSYRLVSDHDPIWLANVRWLAAYRHPRFRVDTVALALLDVFTEPEPLISGARKVGDHVAVLPVLYHLLWRRELAVDLAVRLEGSSLVSRRSR